MDMDTELSAKGKGQVAELWRLPGLYSHACMHC